MVEPARLGRIVRRDPNRARTVILIRSGFTEGLWVARTIEFMVQEGWLMNESSFYANFADRSMMKLKNRETTMPAIPINQTSANPVNN